MKLYSRLAVIALLIAAVGGGLYWQQQRSAAQRRLEAWELQQVEEAIPAAWDQSFAWEKADVTLADLADLAATKSGLIVELDEAGIAATRSWQVKPREIAVHVPPGEYPLHVLLKMVLNNDGLCADLRGQQVVITAQAASTMRTRMQTVVYPLPQPLPEGLDEEAWRFVIAGAIEGHVEAVPGALVVVENALGHRRVRATIDAICQLDKQAPQPLEIPPVDEANHQRLLSALAEPTSCDFVENTLVDVVRILTESHRVPLVLDVRPINDAGVSLDTPLTKNLQSISLQSALRLMLSDLELTFTLSDDAILITTPEQAESQLRTVAYPVEDVVGPPGSDRLTELTGIIDHAIAPSSWDSVGGAGAIRGINSGWLVVNQTGEIHAQVADFLGLLRSALASKQHFGVSPAQSGQPQHKIRDALERHIELNLNGQTLKDAVSLFYDQLGIPIVLNTKRLDEAGVSIDMPVSVPLRSGRAGLYLDLALEPYELVAVIRDEVLLITTPEDAESQLDTRLYDTRALLKEAFQADDLRELIAEVVHPTMWGNFNAFDAPNFFRDIFVVSQTQEVHRDLERLLAALHQHCLRDAAAEVEQPWIVPVDARAEQLKLEAQLQQIISVQIDNQPLEDALAQLAKQYGLAVIYARLRMADAGYSLPLPPETLSASDITLRDALRRLLAPQRLDYVVRENVIYVTTASLAADRSETRMYRISNLVPSRWPSAAEFEQGLQAAAAGSTETKASMENASTATIEPGWLLLRGSRRLHQRVAAWLTDLRTSK